MGPNMFGMNAASGGQFGQNYGDVRGQNQMNPQIGPAALIPIGMSLGGMFLGNKNKKDGLDWDAIQKMFGGQALSSQTNQLFNMLQGSPQFTGMMQGASQLGNQMQSRLAQNVGQSGLGGTPMAGMMKAAGMGYGGQLRLQGQQQLFMQALQQAMQQQGMQATMFNQQQQIPNFWSQVGGALMGGGAQGMMGLK